MSKKVNQTKFTRKQDAIDYLVNKGWRQLGQSRDIYWHPALKGQRREVFNAHTKWEIRAYG